MVHYACKMPGDFGFAAKLDSASYAMEAFSGSNSSYVGDAMQKNQMLDKYTAMADKAFSRSPSQSYGQQTYSRATAGSSAKEVLPSALEKKCC